MNERDLIVEIIRTMPGWAETPDVIGISKKQRRALKFAILIGVVLGIAIAFEVVQ